MGSRTDSICISGRIDHLILHPEIFLGPGTKEDHETRLVESIAIFD